MDNNLGLILTKRAFLTPDRQAYIGSHEDGHITFSELNKRSNQVANAFLDAGVQKGERVGLLLMNSIEFVETYFALAKIGAVVVPLNWRLVADELEFILKDSGTTRLLFGDEFADTAAILHSRGNKTNIKQWLQVSGEEQALSFAESYRAFRDATSASEPAIIGRDDDILFIMYTAGTTGLPKGVVHTHNSAIWEIIALVANLYYYEADRFLITAPMFHAGALIPLAINVYRGATSVVMRSFEPRLAWDLIDRERITTGLLVPAMLNFMLQVEKFDDQYDFSQLRWLLVGAAPVPLELIKRYTTMGITLLQTYGMTEVCGSACLMDSDKILQKPDSTGKALFHCQVRVVDTEGNDCASGELGEVIISGKNVMREYWNNPQATAEALVDGWFHTGDVATMDDEGYVSIQGRIKDMIISGGENICPAEIENVLMCHSEILEAAVIGQECDKWGETPLAIVVKTVESLTADDVLQFCRGKLAQFKQPKRVEFIDEIPRNASGKILKRILREKYTSEPG